MSQRDKGFVSASNTSLQVITPGADIAFNAIGLKNSGFKIFPGSSSFIAKRSGKYNYDFQVNGTVANAGQACVLCLTLNGNVVAGTLSVGSGSGIIKVRSGDLITLRLAPNSPGGVLTLDSSNIANANSAAITLSQLER